VSRTNLRKPIPGILPRQSEDGIRWQAREPSAGRQLPTCPAQPSEQVQNLVRGMLKPNQGGHPGNPEIQNAAETVRW